MKRQKTSYPGVFFREAERIGKKGSEKVFYIVFKKNGKTIEEKAGRQYVDDMTPARAAGIRSDRIEGKRLSRKEFKDLEKSAKEDEASKWTVDRLFQKYIKNRPDNKGRKVDTGRYDKFIKPKFGKQEPKEIIPLNVDRLRINLLKKKSPQTVKHVLNLLTWIVNFGVKRNLCSGLKFHIQKPTVYNIKTEDLSQDQLKRLLDVIEVEENIQVANLMRMAIYTGMRRGELFKLQWTHIDTDKGFISIVDPKGGPDQKIPLNQATREVLKLHPKISQYIFPGRGGQQRTDINHQVNRIKEKAGLPDGFRPLHGLRHVYASMLASSGKVDMYTLQKLLTHKDPKMTQRYAHLRDDALKKASDLAGSLIEEAINF